MKKILSITLAVIIIFFVFPINTYAKYDDIIISQKTEYLDNGFYIIKTLTVESQNNLIRTSSTKTGSKTITIFNSDDEAMVTLKLTASFSYTGTSATCTSVTPSYTIHNSYWKVPTAIGTKNGNTAKGEFTAKKYWLGLLVQTINESTSITCSNTGVLS